MIRVSQDDVGRILYDGLYSHYWLPDMTRIQIECDYTNNRPICWYRLIYQDNNWGVMSILTSKEVKEILAKGSIHDDKIR